MPTHDGESILTLYSDAPSVTLTDFSVRRPRYEVDQRRSLDWLAEVHAASQATTETLTEEQRVAFVARIRKVMDRCACGPSKIRSRGHVVSDVNNSKPDDMTIYDVRIDPSGKDAGERARLFDDVVSSYFEEEYENENCPPSDIVHVTCTGYVSPSGAQKLVSNKGWGDRTRVTHAYHMGCYAAFPATRMAAGFLYTPKALTSEGLDRRVDIVHTELCSLHLDPRCHAIEQLVVESLFADGFVRYSLRGERHHGLEVLALHEAILGDSLASMRWAASHAAMQMTLAPDVPEKIAGALRGFVTGLYQKAGLGVGDDLARSVFAVHPGGPKIIDRAREVLELTEAQVRASRDVLFDYGNMSSATLPHVWARIVADDAVPRGTPVVSLAFGPGLTVSGGIFRKI
jgi:predicted naringenin-chalcone synthase